MARTDIHRPSAPEFDPIDYDCRGVFYLGENLDAGWTTLDRGQHAQALADLHAQGITRGGVYGSRQCSHCGAHISYAALMVHRPTSTYLHIGEDCLDNRFELDSRAKFQALRKAAALNRERVARRERIAALIDRYPLLADLTYPQITSESSDFVYSIARQFRENGRLSERQIESVCNALTREIERRERDAQRAREDADAAPLPIGRMVIIGVVVSIKEEDDPYTYGGTVRKMLVKNAAGWRVWGTVPSALRLHLAVGDSVKFTATTKPKDGGDDLSFGYFSRPTQASVLTAVKG